MFFLGTFFGMFLLAMLLAIGYFMWNTHQKLSIYEDRFLSIDEQIKFLIKAKAKETEKKTEP